MRFSNTETIRTGKREDEVIELEEVWMEPVLSDMGVVGEDMLDLMELINKRFILKVKPKRKLLLI